MNQDVPAPSVGATADNRAKVFVSYSRKDAAFAQMMVAALAERGLNAFLDKTDIAPGEPWKERLFGLIATADTVVFTVSPDSVASTICCWELEESTKLGKRIIPVVARRIADANAPPALGRLNWIFFTEDDDKDAALATLNTALQTDLPWVREHTRLGELARHWDEEGRSKSATLRGADLEAAERWLDRRPADANAPTDLHQDFIRASRRAATSRQRYLVGGSLIVALVAITLAVFAQTQRERAEHTLSLATNTANSLVVDLAKQFRDVVGVPAGTIKDILDRAHKLQDQLLGSGESSPGLRQSQAAALREIAITLLTLGDTKSALTAAKQAQEILQALLAQQPGSTDFQSDLSTADTIVGDVQMAKGDTPAALTAYQASREIISRLASSDPSNASWQSDLSASYERAGEVQGLQGDLPAALTSYQTALAISDRLAKSDPGNAFLQRDLSVSYYKIGEIQAAQGDLPAALTSYQADLAIMDHLTKSHPGNSRWQRDLSVAYDKTGDIQAVQGDLQAALTSYEANLAIADRLATSDPSNADWQRDLIVSYVKIAQLVVPSEARAILTRAYEIAIQMQSRGQLAPRDAWMPDDLERRIAKLPK